MNQSGLPLLKRLADYVDTYARSSPQAVAIVFGAERICYAELKGRIDQFSKALIACGVRKGDRVAMLCSPRPEFLVAFLATTAVGALWIGLNPRHRLREFRYVVGDSTPSVLLTLTQLDDRSYDADIRCLIAENDCIQTVVSFGGSLEGTLTWEQFLQRGREISDKQLSCAGEGVSRMDPALIVYTSGTTGEPKGAVISHYGLSYGAVLQTRHVDLPNLSMAVSFPINHVACVADTCAVILVSGGTIIFHEQFDPAVLAATVESERCTMVGAVPTMLVLALPHLLRHDISSLRLIIWGGAALPQSLISVLQGWGVRLMNVYGMTETSCNVTYTDVDATLEVLASTVGKPDPRCEFRIVDETGSSCENGQVGELQFKAPFLTLGYWRREGATAAAFTEGWLRTGDLGFRRDDGNVTLVGRKSEMYKSGGYNIYPREIEVLLEQHPAVTMAAVIGVPDELYQEVGHAYVAIRSGQALDEAALREHCRQHLANYKVPKRFFLRETLPVLPVGKIDKQALRRAGGP